MVIETETSVAVLTAWLRVIDRALARFTALRFRLLARIDQLLNPDANNGRVVASTVAQTSKCPPAQAAGELVLARKLGVLPAISEAFANGEVSTGQIAAVAMIASPGDEQHALELAKTATSAVLEREAAVRRKDLFEQRQRAQTRRFVTFKPSPDQSSIMMIAGGPWAETYLLQQRLEKIAAQLEKGAGDAKSPFATRMYDALIILTHGSMNPPAEAPASSASTRPVPTPLVPTRLDTRNGPATGACGRVAVAERDDEPFPNDPTSHNSHRTSHDSHPAGPVDNQNDTNSYGTRFEPHGYDDDIDGDDDRCCFDDPDEPFPANPNPTMIVTRANTKIVVHYDARTGIVNYQNGPPLDHPRLTALLCDASLEVIHYDQGTPNGIITTQRTKTDRQARYLAHRDGPCRIPACTGIGYTHAHHTTPASIKPGHTETASLINLCNYHHNQHHDGTLTITGNPEATITITFTDGHTVTSTTPTR